MDWLFDADKPLMRGLSAIADLLILNLLTILCSIPVITAGPAIIALFTTVIRMVRNEDGSLVRDYFRAFSANLKLGILFWIFLLICMGLLYFDYLAAQAYAPVMSPVIAAMGVLVLAVSFYIFGLLARYADTLKVTIKKAIFLAVGYFPRTLAMTAFFMAFWVLSIRYIQFGAPILLMFGLSLPCYVCAILMNGIFTQLENKKG